MANKFYELF